MAMIKIPQSLYVDIQVAAERMVPPVSATYLLLTHLYKAFPPGAWRSLVPNLAPHSTNATPATQTKAVSEPSDADKERWQQIIHAQFTKKAPADD